MGLFYTNLTLRGPEQADVIKALRKRKAYVSPTVNRFTLVYDADDLAGNLALASTLSKTLACPVLFVNVHDDDVMYYQLHWRGKLVDDYDSCPSYFDPDAEPAPPDGGDATKLCDAFGSNAIAETETILRASSFDAGGFVFQTERHAALGRALGMPSYAAGCGHGTIEYGELPAGLRKEELVAIG